MAINLLLSYAFHATTDLAAVRRDLYCGVLMVDSGAFTAYTAGKSVSLRNYASYLEHWRGTWDYAVTLDVIGDPRATAANTRALHARGVPVLPVFTKGGTLADFDAMVKEHRFVCVGGLVGGRPEVQRKRVAMLQRRALDLGGGIHALGVGGMTVLRVALPYSGDSAAHGRAISQGRVLYFDGHRFQANAPWWRKQLIRDRDVIAAHGIDLASIAGSRQLPSGGPARAAYIRTGAVAFACADEALRLHRPTVPAPDGLGPPGARLFVSAGKGQEQVVAQTVAVLHGSNPPPIWRQWGRAHVCATNKTTVL